MGISIIILLQGSEPTTDYRLQLQYNTQKIMTTTTSPAEKPDYNYKSAQLTDYNYRLQLFNLKPARPGISRVVPGLYSVLDPQIHEPTLVKPH